MASDFGVVLKELKIILLFGKEGYITLFLFTFLVMPIGKAIAIRIN
jgi:hypothetical protein